jgi:hypothetical protein
MMQLRNENRRDRREIKFFKDGTKYAIIPILVTEKKLTSRKYPLRVKADSYQDSHTTGFVLTLPGGIL